MRQREVAAAFTLLLVLASLPAQAIPGPSNNVFLHRPPISIHGDANFTAANGVTAGTGSPADPFVISGWNILTGGTAIYIYNTTLHFIVRDNLLESGVGIQVFQSTSVGVLENNKIIVKNYGIIVGAADMMIRNNSLIAEGRGEGILIQSGNSVVEENAFNHVRTAIHAERGSPTVRCNDIHRAVSTAIYVRFTTNATIDCNIVTDCHYGIYVRESTQVNVTANFVTTCDVGVQFWTVKDSVFVNNTVRFSFELGVWYESTSGCMMLNVIIDGGGDGVQIWHSPILIANNTIRNNIAVGLHFAATAGNATGNIISRNGVGIALNGGDAVNLTANVMTNNTVGLSIPYAARRSIPLLSANLVNGVNVDGTLVASEKVFFYREANVTITGVRDSGFSAGYYGSLTGQGGVVLYEVNTAHVNDSLIAHHNIGVGVVNSFNVNVNRGNLFSNLVGVEARVDAGGSAPPIYGGISYDDIPTGVQLPNCVVSIKDTNVTIPVDPVLTIGIDVHGCFAIVGRVNISIVDTGIRVDGAGMLKVFNSTVNETRIALDVQGKAGGVNITGNLIVGNVQGARLSGTVGVVANNTFLDNDLFGVRIAYGANLTLTGNNFTANGEGLIDAQVCLGGLGCSKVTARDNAFVDNAGDGARVNGASTWRGDVALGNGGDGFELGTSATMRAVLAAGNEGDGARIVGTFFVQDSRFSANAEDGLEVRGSGDLRDSNFTFNGRAGLMVTATIVNAVRINASFNFDGILAATGQGTGGVPTNLPALLALTGGVGTGAPAPFDIHLSSFVGNQRDAVRAGAAVVNATHNYWGKPTGPSLSVFDQVGAFQNGVSPAVRFVPFFTDPAMTTTGPVPGI